MSIHDADDGRIRTSTKTICGLLSDDLLLNMADIDDVADEVVMVVAPLVKEDNGNTLANHVIHAVPSPVDVMQHKLRHGK